MATASQDKATTTAPATEHKTAKARVMRTGAKKPARALKKTGVVAAHGSHPTYGEMIAKAIAAVSAGRKGASKVAILKYIVATYNIGGTSNAVNAHLNAALKRLVIAGDLIQVKGHGATGSFRLGAVAKTGAGAKKKTVTKKTNKKETPGGGDGTPKKPHISGKKVDKITTAGAKKTTAKGPKTTPKKKVPASSVAPAAATKAASPPSTPVKKTTAGKSVRVAKTPRGMVKKSPAKTKAGKVTKQTPSKPKTVKKSPTKATKPVAKK